MLYENFKSVCVVFLHYLLLVIVGLSIIWGARVGLPEYSDIGIEDMRSAVFVLSGFFILLCMFQLRKTMYCFVFLVCVFVICNWWQFEFYQTYIVISDFKIGTSVLEVSRSFHELFNLKHTIFFLIPIVFILGIEHKLFNTVKLPKHIMLSCCIVSFSLGYTYQIRMMNEGIPLAGKNSDPIMYFMRSIADLNDPEHMMVTQNNINAVDIFSGRKSTGSPHPLHRKIKNSDKKKYNVILVLLESVRANEVGVYNRNNLSVTPNLNAIANENAYLPRAYANSVQTIRGELAILCSLFDLSMGSPISNYNMPLKAKCLPEILKNSGMDTYWFHGYTKKMFNRENFHPSMGFSHIFSQENITPQLQQSKEIGWELSDEQVFDFSLDVLEKSAAPCFLKY